MKRPLMPPWGFLISLSDPTAPNQIIPCHCPECQKDADTPHASDCNIWVDEPCNCITGHPEPEVDPEVATT